MERVSSPLKRRRQDFHVWNVFQHEGGIDMMQHDKKFWSLALLASRAGPWLGI